jgi:catechol 2,3-dioxygenase-like lactoylglutathione lyase family enzyme
MSTIELLSTVPVFSVSDMRRSLAFYRDRLGFDVSFDIGMYAGVKRGGMELHLDGGAHEYSSRPTCCRFHIRGVDALYAGMQREDFIKADERLATKHMRQFSVVDPDGNRITFAQPLE